MDSFGQFFKLTIFGESHGPAIGVTIDGVPENIPLDEEDFATDIARRAPGRKGTTARKEADRPRILSGTYEGYTTGSPLTILFWNSNVESQDYLKFDDVPRPGHGHLLKKLLVSCRGCDRCRLREHEYICPENCPKRLSDGPCGGVRADGGCEVDGVECVHVRVARYAHLLNEFSRLAAPDAPDGGEC